MEIDLILKIAGIGIIVAFISIILKRADKDDQAMLVSIAGIIVVLLLIVPQMGDLFDSIKNAFGLW